MGQTNITKDAANKTLIMEREFNAPRQRVWQAWTDPRVFEKWWGPRGFETTVKDYDFRAGGSGTYGMKCVDENQGEWFGQTSWGKMEFIQVNEPDSFVYKDFFCDENGVVSDEMPVMTITLEFFEENGKTRVVSTGVFDNEEGYNKVLAMGVVEGASETWDRLDELVSQA